MLMKLKFSYQNDLRLIESSKSGKTWKVMIIEEGMSRNGKYYPEKVLKGAANLFEDAKAFYYEWKGKHFDHLPEVIEKIRPEGFPRQIAGWYDNVKYETVSIEGQKKSGLTALLHIHEGAKWLSDMLRSAWDKGQKKILGLSINAEGPSQIRMANGKPLDVVAAITRVFGVDVVTQPAAGGQLLRLVASQSDNKTKENLKMFEALLKILKETRPELLKDVDVENITESQITDIFQKALDSSDNKVKEALQKEKNALEKTKKEAEDLKKKKDLEETEAKKKEADFIELAKKKKADELAKKKAKEAQETEEQKKKRESAEAEAQKKKDLEEAEAKAKKEAEEKEKMSAREAELGKKLADIEKKIKTRELNEQLKLLLDESKLPAIIRNKIEKRFKNTVFMESDISDSIKEEKEVLAKLSESGDIVNLGDDKTVEIKAGSSKKDRLQAATALMIEPRVADDEKDAFDGVTPFKGIREAYIKITGDTEVSGQIPVARLHEAVPTWESGDFTKIMGYTLGRRLLKEYRGIPGLWKSLANAGNIKDFKMQEIIRWGGFGTLPEVIAARSTQGTATDTTTPTYADLGFANESSQLYALATKGGMVTVTRRMVINDDTKALQRIPSAVGKAAARTLNQFVFDLMLNYSGGINAGTKWPDGAGSANSVALYSTNNMNYQTTSLSWDGIDTMLTRLYNQVEKGFKTEIDSTWTAGNTSVSVDTDEGTPFIKAGDYLYCEGEIIRVDTVSNDTLSVVARGQFGTTDATHAIDDEVYVVTQFLGLGETAKPILWVPRALKGEATELITSPTRSDTAERAGNAIYNAAEVMASPYLRGDVNNYYLTANKSEAEFIELGFLNGKEEPEILVQDSPTAGNVFVYDVTRYKVRHEYGGVVVDYTPAQGSIVT